MYSSVEMMVRYLWKASLISLQQVFVLMGPGFVLAFLMNYLAGIVEKSSYSLMGRKAYLGLFGWLGTIIHELGHAFFCIVFRHKIKKIRLFNYDPKSGSLGYINHSYNPNSTYQRIGNFFIGIGPILFASIVIYSLSRYLLGSDIFQSIESLKIQPTKVGIWAFCLSTLTTIWEGVKILCVSLFTVENLTNWRFYFFLYIVFCIGSSMKLSRRDIEGARSGFGSLIVIFFLANLVTHWIIGNDLTKLFGSLIQYYSVLYTVMLFAIALNVIATFVLLMILISSKVVTRLSTGSSKNDL